MTQMAGAFGRVESALTFFIARYQSLASYTQPQGEEHKISSQVSIRGLVYR
jgi:hypothetical protein